MPRSRETAGIVFPSWMQASDRRRAHAGRVIALLDRWAAELPIAADEADRWRTAGLLHDALRDAPERLLRELTKNASLPADLLHGPAAAARAEQDGETRADVLDAVRYHTVGCVTWARTGQALYMADFLEPERNFLLSERAFLADQVARDFAGAFRQVVRLRLEWSLKQDGELFQETVDLWHAVR